MEQQKRKLRILVFLQGTVLMHSGALAHARAERVLQSRNGSDPSVKDPATYVPVGNAAAKLRRWRAQGAQIIYLTSNRDPIKIAADARVLMRNGFPEGTILARAADETYGYVAGRAMPDILVEDDCESIGASEVTYPQIPLDLRRRIKSIIVPEFGGIDHLPDSLQALLESGPD